MSKAQYLKIGPGQYLPGPFMFSGENRERGEWHLCFPSNQPDADVFLLVDPALLDAVEGGAQPLVSEILGTGVAEPTGVIEYSGRPHPSGGMFLAVHLRLLSQPPIRYDSDYLTPKDIEASPIFPVNRSVLVKY